MELDLGAAERAEFTIALQRSFGLPPEADVLGPAAGSLAEVAATIDAYREGAIGAPRREALPGVDSDLSAADNAELSQAVAATLSEVLKRLTGSPPTNGDAPAADSRATFGPMAKSVIVPAVEAGAPAVTPRRNVASSIASVGSNEGFEDGLAWASSQTQTRRPRPRSAARNGASMTAAPAPVDLEDLVLDTVATVTRYPRDILVIGAKLEDDLGIDSVKQAEILGVLQKRLGLPEDSDAPIDPQEVRTLGDMVRVAGLALRSSEADEATLANGTTPNGGEPEASDTPPVALSAPSVALSDVALESLVVETMVEVTRYPSDLLTLDAQLEDDLGIDSVKQAEILGVLQRRLGLPEDSEAKVDPQGIRTVGDVARAARAVLDEAGAAASSAAPPAAEPAPMAAPPAAPPRPIPAGAASTGTSSTKSAPMVARDGNGVTSSKTQADMAKLYREHGLEPGLAYGAARRPTTPEPYTVLQPEAGARRPAPARFVAEGHRPLAGRVALVTGSGHGIGRVIARRLAGLGARTIVNSFHSRERGEETCELIRSAGGEAVHVWGSVTNPDHMERMFGEIEARFGFLDVFVSNAANGIVAPLHMVTTEHWNRAFQTNIFGLHQGALKATPLMRRRGGGKIFCISSPGAQRYIEHFGCLGPVKAALESLTRYLAVELAPHNIQVNAISAGAIYGELLDKYPDGGRLVPYWESRTPGNELGREEEIANFLALLLSSWADRLTGTVLVADQGGTLRV